MDKPLDHGMVTVIALCYNQAPYLRQSLDSIMQQTYPVGKFYIIDDGSTDGSVELIRQWLDENNHPAEFIPHEQNMGITRTMNQALSLCNTKYFHPWPCDDLLMPDKIESQIRYLESLDWQPGFLYGDIQWIDENSVVFRDSIINDRRKLFPDGQMPSGNIFPQLVMHGCFIPTASGFYVTQPLKDLGGFDEKLYAEDWDMFMRIALKHGIAFKNQVFSQYRRHRNSAEMKKGERYWDGHFKILPRFIGINAQYDKMIGAKLCNDAIEASKLNYFKASRFVLHEALRRFNFKLFYVYLRMRLRAQSSSQ